MNLWRTEKKEYNKKIEIVWLYYSIMSQLGWKDYCKEELLSLEQSLNLGLWKNAEYYILELQALLNEAIKELKNDINKIKISIKFLEGIEEYSRYLVIKKEEIAKSEKNFLRAKALGLKFVNSEVFSSIITIIKDFLLLINNYTGGIKNLELRRDVIKDLIDKTELDPTLRSNINNFLEDLSFDKYHIKANKQPRLKNKEKRYLEVKKKMQESNIDINSIVQWFEPRTIENFYENFCKDQFEVLKAVLDQKLTKMKDMINNSTIELKKIMVKVKTSNM